MNVIIRLRVQNWLDCVAFYKIQKFLLFTSIGNTYTGIIIISIVALKMYTLYIVDLQSLHVYDKIPVCHENV